MWNSEKKNMSKCVIWEAFNPDSIILNWQSFVHLRFVKFIKTRLVKIFKVGLVHRGSPWTRTPCFLYIFSLDFKDLKDQQMHFKDVTKRHKNFAIHWLIHNKKIMHSEIIMQCFELGMWKGYHSWIETLNLMIHKRVRG